jgi:SRSO17 transposase
MKTHIVKYENIFNVLQTDLNTTAIINTQPIKSSLLLSQFSYQDINISKILSTQINYSPLLLALTQAKDLKKLYIANSITTKNNKIEDINSLLHNDIAYNWINYSTTILMDFIFQSINKEYSSKSKHFDLMSHDKQILYPVGIYKVRYKRFFRYK